MFRRSRTPPPPHGSVRDFLHALRWLDKGQLLARMESYRLRLFERFFDDRDDTGRQRYNLCVSGRAKKNAKTLDLCLAELYAVMSDSTSGSQCYLLANDRDQAADDLALLKKLIGVNGFLSDLLKVKKNIVERRDGNGFIEILPAQDVAGSHGKTYRLVGFDEIHAYRTWDLLEAMQFDPTRPESQMWITSYASLFHKPGVPLFDMMARGKAGTDPRMLFSWYGADFSTDADFVATTPEQRANPSMASWGDNGEYLAQQQRRLPAHKYRRLHLNLPGLPEGSAFQPEPVMDSIVRGVPMRAPERAMTYHAFVDMSGGSNDDAVLAIGHQDANGKTIVDRVLNQGPPPPFDPRKAVARFADALQEYRIASVTGDKYAGETFVADFNAHSISYVVSDKTKSEIYESMEPLLNGRRVVLCDAPLLEQQLLGLVWRGGKIDHANGEHDDWANAACGVVVQMSLHQTCEPGELAQLLETSIASSGPLSGTFESAFGSATDLSSMERNAYGKSSGLADAIWGAFGRGDKW